MASKSDTSTTLLVLVNLPFFSLVSACDTCNSSPKPKPKPENNSGDDTCCPDIQELGLCTDMLRRLFGVIIGTPVAPCCILVRGLADLEAAICLCDTVNILGLSLHVPLPLWLLLNACSKKAPLSLKQPNLLLLMDFCYLRLHFLNTFTDGVASRDTTSTDGAAFSSLSADRPTSHHRSDMARPQMAQPREIPEEAMPPREGHRSEPPLSQWRCAIVVLRYFGCEGW
ncbi:unnamed protein product [Fraxinus pennsylvanica]|uniref:Hydrophobic seed protein domain-containing protein n=1 Tax=Fraxinus pennsylvanica TaxID=56036 RepID=A0AAD1YPW8_9LAMI|nr:unnamed protein product [Fraxinus pennsylvanica]